MNPGFHEPTCGLTFGKAKEPPPANYDRDFAAAVGEGWIHEDGAESYLTSKGLEAVEAGLRREGPPSRTCGWRRRDFKRKAGSEASLAQR